MSGVTIPAPETETFEMNVSLEDGTSVNIAVTYPEGQGLSAITSLAHLGTNEGIQNMIYQLRADPSVAAHLEKKGVAFLDAEEDY